MKTRHLIALFLLLAGTNVFTYVTTRLRTTQDVLTRADDRLEMALKKDGVYDQLYTTRRSPNSPQILSDLEVAILGAGGMEHWGGFAMLYWLT